MVEDDDELAYTFDYKPRHLTEKEVLTRYQNVKTSEPDALVVLEDLDCGHWTVNVYRTKREKNNYLKHRADSLIQRLLERIKSPMEKR